MFNADYAAQNLSECMVSTSTIPIGNNTFSDVIAHLNLLLHEDGYSDYKTCKIS